MTPQEALARVIEHREIFHEEMLDVMRQIMSGEVSPVMIAAIIVGLRVKKETIEEIAAAAQVMRDFSTKVPVSDKAALVDTCGTGGDSAHTFNISTAAAFVASAAGARVAKHGGRSVSSTSGSADVLESLGANLAVTPEQVAQCIDRVGVGFMFAPSHHSAMKHAAPVRPTRCWVCSIAIWWVFRHAYCSGLEAATSWWFTAKTGSMKYRHPVRHLLPN